MAGGWWRGRVNEGRGIARPSRGVDGVRNVEGERGRRPIWVGAHKLTEFYSFTFIFTL